MPVTFVVCLCAEWCSACRAYREVFDAVARAARGGVRFGWIDIEDHPEVLGDMEIETFPTLLVAHAGGVVFYGAVAPHASTLSGLADRAANGELAALDDAAIAAVAARAARFAGG